MNNRLKIFLKVIKIVGIVILAIGIFFGWAWLTFIGRIPNFLHIRLPEPLTVMHLSINEIRQHEIIHETLHSANEKSTEEWFERVKPFIEAGWWPDNKADIDYLESLGYKQPDVYWRSSQEIINNLMKIIH